MSARSRSRLRFPTCAAVAVALSIGSLASARQAARDVAPRPAIGTASIAGTVVVNDADGHPIRRVTVTLNSAQPGQFAPRVAVTDDKGRFVFANLPAGAYSAPRAMKAGYVPATYGEKRPNGVGMPISLTEGQRLSIGLKMFKGAVITGMVRHQGRPVQGVQVQAIAVRIVDGVRTSGSVQGGSAQTDDRGTYRIHGIAPGEFVVSCTPRFASGELRPITDAEIQWAERQLQGQPGSTSATSGAAQTLPKPAQAITHTSVYFPGTTDATRAGVLTLEPGAERAGVDFELMFVPTAKIEGRVLDANGNPASNPQLNLVPRIDTNVMLGDSFFMLDMMMLNRATVADGRFSFAGIRPGEYTIAARAAERGAPIAPAGRGGGPAATLWASADITVNGEDQAGIELRLQPGMKLTGRVAFEAATLPVPTDFSRINVRLSAAPTASGVAVSVNIPSAIVGADGTFTLEGLSPGRYFMSASAPAVAPGTTGQWLLKSARVGDVDAADRPFDVVPNKDLSNIVLTFTDRISELTGTLLDGANRPTAAMSVILFGTDRSMWSQRSRRLRFPVRTGADGRFRFASVLPGEYFLAVLTDYEPGDLYKPEFLEQVAAASMKITIAEGEKKVQDLKIAGG
jgi:hypothetical protein